MSDVIFILGLLGCAVGLAICVVMLVRNQHVFSYRKRVIQRIYEDLIADLNGKPSQGLQWDVLDAVDYDLMVTRFWRPLSSFFPREYQP